MARKSRYREYLNAVRNVKVLSKAPQRRTTHEPIRKRLKELKQAEKAEKQGGGSNCGFWFIDIRSAKPSSSACISGAQPDRPRSVLGGLGAPLNERLCLLGTSRHCLPQLSRIRDNHIECVPRVQILNKYGIHRTENITSCTFSLRSKSLADILFILGNLMLNSHIFKLSLCKR